MVDFVHEFSSPSFSLFSLFFLILDLFKV